MLAMRQAAKSLITVGFWNHVAAEGTACSFALLGIVRAAQMGDSESAGLFAGRLMAGLFCFWLIAWIARDARRTADRLRAEREAREEAAQAAAT